MKLYGYWRSSCSWRARIALHWKGLPFAYEAVHLVQDGGQQNTERYRALNPQRTVPLLELEEGGRTVRLSQSMAILEFLEERVPEPPLLPRDAIARAQVRMIAEGINSGIQPYQNLATMQHVASLHADDKAWSAHWIQRGLIAVEALVAQLGGRFCVGDAVSFADLCLVPQLYGARRFHLDVAQFPHLLRVEQACAALPAFQKAHPDAQPDAVKS